MTKQVKAVGFHRHLPIINNESFENVLIDTPTASGNDILVKVDSISVNPVDTFVRRGGRNNKLVKPKIIGWDAVGTVIAKGDKVSLFNIGDRVWYAGDFTRSGSNAQYQLVDEKITGLAPNNLDDSQAATAFVKTFSHQPTSSYPTTLKELASQKVINELTQTFAPSVTFSDKPNYDVPIVAVKNAWGSGLEYLVVAKSDAQSVAYTITYDTDEKQVTDMSRLILKGAFDNEK